MRVDGDLVLKKNLDLGNEDLFVEGNIFCESGLWDIKAEDINAGNIKAEDIKAKDISYYAVCFVYKNIICKSIKGRGKNSKHFVLDGKIEVNK